MSTHIPPVTDVSADVLGLERDLERIAYLTKGARQHERLMTVAGVSLDRAATTLLRQIADGDPMRPGELAVRLGVEASHVTRQAQQLERSGYVTREPDPDDRRAQRIHLTPAGRDAIARIREANCRGMQMVLARWSPEELGQLAGLFRRMVDDFFTHAAEDPHTEPQKERS
jgi:DNA-binding MarR family transcriptional regulator